MDFLTEATIHNFVNINLNKPCLIFQKVGRLIGYIKNENTYAYCIKYGFGMGASETYIEAGLKLTFIEPDNEIYEETEKLLSLNGCSPVSKLLFEDFSEDPLFSQDRYIAGKALAQSLFNTIISNRGNAYRVVGYSFEDFSVMYICYDVYGNKTYQEFYVRQDFNALSQDLVQFLEDKIPTEKSIIFEDNRDFEE